MMEKRKCLKYVKAIPGAFTPTKGSPRAAGFDLRSVYSITVPARDKALINTGLKFELPSGCYGRIAPRSGLASKNGINVGAGVIDQDYRGIVMVLLFNHSNEDFQVNVGDRIAQLICERIHYPELVEEKELTHTERNTNGFGSTGR
ncbi:deoxyuridine 5'-triphosphate nucleotidohydrolase-like [Sitophilus oryzae]|uniref:Deoxyuridine 5'-triphosphate nucleotidohydrolase n=1 Tax=Sitophilus oryzae TaxID=7048 RepID=A0A6J2X459_SITOR|nr:deoxyuridine 5'-triphosphate nucleotidohydrolase-like [Sitophilus oryzae]